MKNIKLCFGSDGLDGIEVPEPQNPFFADMCLFGGMTQDEREAEADREEAVESKGR